MRVPPSQVDRTRPRTVRPAYGVILWRTCSSSAEIVHSALSSNTQKSASMPTASAPLLERPARAEGADDIQRATSLNECPRREASVHTIGRPSPSELIPPHALPKSPDSSA